MRRVVAAVVVVAWVAGLIALWKRRTDVPLAERLARGALQLGPAT